IEHAAAADNNTQKKSQREIDVNTARHLGLPLPPSVGPERPGAKSLDASSAKRGSFAAAATSSPAKYASVVVGARSGPEEGSSNASSVVNANNRVPYTQRLPARSHTSSFLRPASASPSSRRTTRAANPSEASGTGFRASARSPASTSRHSLA